MKRKFSFLLILVLVVSAFALMLAACDKNPDGDNEIVLQVWGADEDQEFLKEVAEAYKKANADKTYLFRYGKQSEKDAADKLLDDVTRGADVFAFSSDQLNKLVQRGALQRLGGEIEQKTIEDNTAESIDGCSLTINGTKRLYAMPFTDNTFYVYYDKSKFELSDLATLDGILAKCDATHQFAYPMEDSWYISAFYFGKNLGYNVEYNEQLAETKIECDFDCPDGLAVTEAINGYVQNPGMKPNSNDSKLIAGFTDGSIIAGASGLWNASAIKAILKDNFGCIALPTYTLNGQQVPMRPFAGYKCIGVNSQSANRTEAMNFALFLNSYENQVKRFEDRGYSPTNKEAMKLEKITQDECVKAIQQQLLCCKPQSGVPSTFWSPLENMGKAMVAAAIDPTADPFVSAAQLTATVKQITGEATAK